ncbi:hypothetical protein WDW89_05275 [Deltaproteobacteria bacterium TL4]
MKSGFDSAQPPSAFPERSRRDIGETMTIADNPLVDGVQNALKDLADNYDPERQYPNAQYP